MASSDVVSDDTSVVIVSVNISEINETINGTRPKAFMKRPNDDSSLNNIILGIGVVVVVLIFILIIIKLIQRCWKMYQEENDDKNQTEPKNSPLLPSPSSKVVRRNSSIRNPTGASHRSSLPVTTLMDFREKRLSQTLINI